MQHKQMPLGRAKTDRCHQMVGGVPLPENRKPIGTASISPNTPFDPDTSEKLTRPQNVLPVDLSGKDKSDCAKTTAAGIQGRGRKSALANGPSR